MNENPTGFVSSQMLRRLSASGAVLVALLLFGGVDDARAADTTDDTWSAIRSLRLATPIVVGIRVGYTDERSAQDGAGLGVTELSTIYHEGAYSLRAGSMFRLGVSQGIEGEVAGDLAFGRRFDFTKESGVFVRGGASGFYVGNDRVVVSALEVPQAQVGVQYMTTDRAVLLELAGHGSLAVAARAEVDDTKRTLKPSPAVGGHAGLGVGPVHLEVQATQIAPNGPDRSEFTVGAGYLCFDIGGGLLFRGAALCGDGRVAYTGLLAPNGDTHRDRTVFLGFTFGLTQ